MNTVRSILFALLARRFKFSRRIISLHSDQPSNRQLRTRCNFLHFSQRSLIACRRRSIKEAPQGADHGHLEEHMDDNDDLISELQDLRRDLGATYQRTCGAMNRAELLNGLGWDYGEERVRLEHLKRDFPWLRASITDAIREIKKRVVTGEVARELVAQTAGDIHFAKETLDDIGMPKLSELNLEGTLA